MILDLHGTGGMQNSKNCPSSVLDSQNFIYKKSSTEIQLSSFGYSNNSILLWPIKK